MRSLASRLALTFVLLTPCSSRADWPMARHDVRRTARGDGTASIDRPAASLRHYLGGSLGNEQYVAADVDRDGSGEVLFLMGGALLAKTPDDVIVWETEALDLSRIDGLVDLDGDGEDEIVISAVGGRAYVFRVGDGAVLWSLPSGVVGNVGNVRFADFDGDGTTDLYLAEAACGSTGSLGDVGLAYSFAGGLGAPTMLFQLERGRREYTCGANDTIVDIDGDGRLEVVAQAIQHFYVYSTIDGALESTSEAVGSIPYGLAMTRLADVDADGRMEIVAWTNNNYAPPTNSRRVFLMDWDETTGTLVKRWERSVTDLLDDRHAFGTGGLEDFGGDGRWEIATSFFDAASGAWTTVVLDAATGAQLDSVPRGPFRGLADLDADGSSEVLTGSAADRLYAFRVTDTGLERLFTAEDVEPVLVRDTPTYYTASARSRVLALDLDGDGTDELIAQHVTDGRADALVALSASMDPPREQARLALGADVALLTFEVFSDVTRPRAQILTARSDGYLWVLDEMLRATNADLSGELPQRGLRIGGFYSGRSGIGLVPIAADLDGDGAAEIVARDSRGVLLRLSAASATLVEPPRVDWEIPGGAVPSVVDLSGDGAREIVLAVGGGEIRAIRPDATTVWSATVGSESRSVSYDPVVGDVSGDGTLDVVYQLSNSSGGTVVVDARSGADGSTLWPAEFETVVAGSGLGAMSLADRDGDGLLDVITTPRNLFWWRRGLDGTDLGSIAASYPAYGLFFDVDADGADEILTPGTVSGVHAFESDLTPIWSDSSGQYTRVLGAAVQCPDGARFVQAHYNGARVSAWSTATGATVGDVVLRGGVLSDPPSSAPEGSGIVGDVTIASDLAGSGAPTALLPSTDGFLYAIDPCAMTLQWALDFRFPVGSPILADIDGDGEDEIVVTVADGFLYGVDREVIAAPLFVVENDGTGPAAGPGDDVDEIVTRDTLWANWASVEGAISYEYAVVTPGGAFLTRPNFINVGDVTEVEATGLPLRVGQRYLFAVRAIGAEGASSEALSDGVLVLPDPCDACTEGQICVEGTCRPDPCAGVDCGSGQICVDGTCTSVRPDAGGPDGGVAPDGGMIAPVAGGCCSVVTGGSRMRSTPVVVLALVLGAALAARRRRPRRTRG